MKATGDDILNAILEARVLQVKGVFKFVTPTGKEIKSVHIKAKVDPKQNDIIALFDANVDSELSEFGSPTYRLEDEDGWYPIFNTIPSPFVVIGFSNFGRI
eukprot:GHVU01017394.1.p2 GENE.GHVU01017394.1~~GHVU01017394.1.p2  ORF type:complete len:101 (+),score=10.34 GHVU01017394.1:669-971(+)